MATVRKRSWKSGDETKTAWIADYFDQAGKRHLKTFATKKAADAWLVQTRHQVSQGTHVAENATVTVAEAAALWIRRGEAESLERSTLAKYRNHVDIHINPFIGAVKLSRLTKSAVEQFRDDLVLRLSRSMAQKVLVSLKSIIAEAQRRELVARNVAADTKITDKKRDNRKLAVGRDIPSKAEVNAILGAATGRWRPLLVTAVFTGLRSSELRGLTWDDVDVDRRVIHVRQRADQWGAIGSPKSEAGHREIPMSPVVFNALQEWKLACPRLDGRLSLVFPNGDGKVESHANIINRGFNPIQVKADVSERRTDDKGEPMVDDEGKPVLAAKYGMHALRHFFASCAIEGGFTAKKVQDLLGHSSIQMTFDTYGHLFESLEDDHAKFAALELGIVA
jgi:integrase